MNLASSVPCGTTAVASDLVSVALPYAYAIRAVQLCENRLTSSTLAPLYSESAVLWNSMIRAKLVKGRTDEYRLTGTVPFPEIGTSTIVGFAMLMSADRGRSSPFT